MLFHKGAQKKISGTDKQCPGNKEQCGGSRKGIIDDKQGKTQSKHQSIGAAFSFVLGKKITYHSKAPLPVRAE